MATTEVTIKATRDSLVEIVTAEPKKYSEAELGRILHVSRQRVHDLVKRLGLNDLVRAKHWSFYCLDCGKPISRGGIRCRQCWLKIYGAKMVTLTCDFCGKQFERKESEAKRHKFHFCSRSCIGKYAGQHYGFGAGKAKAAVGKTMPNNNGVWQAHGEEIKQLVGQGVSMAEIGRRLGVSWERIRVLLKKHNLPTRAPMLDQKEVIASAGVMKLRTKVFELYNEHYSSLVELAQAMGIANSQVYRVRDGKRPISEKFIIGAVKAFPGYKLDDLFYVALDGSDGSKTINELIRR